MPHLVVSVAPSACPACPARPASSAPSRPPRPWAGWRRRIGAAAAGLWTLVAVCGPAAAQTPAPPRMQLQAVGEGVYFVQGEAALGSPANRNFISNAGVIVGDDSVLLIDALGSPALAQQWMALIRTVTPLPVRHVVVTHCHADHLYGLQVFKAAGATVIGHSGCREYLNSETARTRLAASREQIAPWIDAQTRLVAPDVWLGEGGKADDLVLSVGRRRVTVRPIGPAHTPEDLIVHDPRSGVVFSGDIVFRGRVPFVGTADSRRWIAALDAVLALEPRVVVPGHGPASRDAGADLAFTRDYLAYLRKTMGEAAAQLEPFDEAYARIDWSRFAGMPMFEATHRANAYNTYLRMEHERP